MDEGGSDRRPPEEVEDPRVHLTEHGYVIDRILGRGCLGPVYLGHHSNRPEDRLSLKLVAIAGPEDALLLQREAGVASGILHPDIVRLERFHAGPRWGILAYRYVEGESLSEVVERGPVDWRRAVTMVTQIAAALAHLHGVGVVHRDIKPSNVIMRPDGRLVLIDLGLALRPDATRITGNQEFKGTFAYCAPEQITGRPLTPATDLYSLGILLHQLVTGVNPFLRPTVEECIWYQLNHAPPRLHLPGAPAELGLLVLELLGKDPALRIVRASELVHRLEALENREAPAAIPELSTALHDHEVLRHLGSGASGSVYLARQISLDREVALKILDSDAGAESLSRFEREMKLVGQLAHPRLIRVLDAGKAGDQLYLSMEYIDGRDLERRLQEEGPFTPRRTIDTALRLIDVLGYLHENGVIHRDLKPANVLCSREGELKLGDTGLARTTDGTLITRAGTIVGTLAYAAPEVLLGQPATVTSDLWSFGVLLHFMLTRRRVIQASSVPEWIRKAQEGDLVRVSTCVAGVPLSLQELIELLLVPDPSRRLSDARQVEDRLRRIAGELGMPAVSREVSTLGPAGTRVLPPPPLAGREQGPTRSSPAALHLPRRILVVAALFGMFSLFLLFFRQERFRMRVRALEGECRMRYLIGDVTGAATVSEELLRLEPDSWTGEVILAMVQDLTRPPGNPSPWRALLDRHRESYISLHGMSTLIQRGEMQAARDSLDRFLRTGSPWALACRSILENQEGRPDRAEADLRAALAEDSSCAWFHQQLAGLLAARGPAGQSAALESIDEAIRLEPDEAHFHTNRAGYLEALGRLPEAMRSAERGAALLSGSPDMELTWTRYLTRMGREEEFYRICESLTRRYPGYAPPYLELARVAISRKDPAAATRWHEECIRNCSSSGIHPVEVAQALEELGRWPEAEAYLREAITKTRSLHPYFGVLMRGLTAHGRLDHWVEVSRFIEEHAPGDHSARTVLARAIASRYPGECVQYLESCLQRFGQRRDWLEVLVMCLMSQEDPEGAVTVSRRMQSLAPLSLEERVALVGALRDLGRLEEAHREIREALRGAPEAGKLLALQAEVFRIEGKLDEAIASAERQVAVNRSSSTLCSLAGLYNEKEDLDVALRLLREAERLSPQPDAEVLGSLGKLHMKRGEYRDSESYYRRLAQLEPGNLTWRFRLDVVRGLRESESTQGRETADPTSTVPE